MGFTHDRAVDLAVAEISALAAVLDGAPPEAWAAPVPTCPGWDLRQLVVHTGEVNRWAAAIVAEGPAAPIRRRERDWSTPADPAALAAWVRDGAAVVEAAMRGADPAAEVWAWGWPKTAGFWPRRMVHETLVHRVDAELTLGGAWSAVDDGVAADGVEELLDNLPHGPADLRGDGQLLRFASGGGTWLVSLQPDGFSWVLDDDDPGADVTLATRSAADLLLTLYRRPPPAPGEVTGDPALLDTWLAASAL